MRKYTVSLSPCLMPLADASYEVLSPPEIHTIFGAKIVYYASPEQGFFHILDKDGHIVFACPTHLVMWSKMEEITEGRSLGSLTLVPSSEET